MAKVASMTAQLWEMQPVQSAVKSFGAGLAVVALMWTSKKAYGLLGSSRLTGVMDLRKILGPEDQIVLDQILVLDEDMAQIFARLEPFRRFYPNEFDLFLRRSLEALKTRQEALKAVSATKAFKVRQSYQKAIEALRLFRALLEKQIGQNIEDFDEIAVDFNSKADQACTDIIQDHALM